MRFAEVVDSAIFAVAPVWGARRKSTRRKFEASAKLAGLIEKRRIENLTRHWEAADKDPLRGETWLTSQLSPNSGLEADLKEVRDRSNDLYRSDDISHGCIESLVTNVIGTSCRPKPRVPFKNFEDVISREQARKVNRELEWLFIRWQPYAGVDGTTWLENMRLAERCLERDGDVLLVMSDVGNARKPIPLAIEVIEADRVETPPSQETNSNVRLGVEVDPKTKAPIAYWVRMSHPGDTVDTDDAYKRIPVYDKSTGRRRASLVFERMYPGQLRGLPRLIAALNTLKDRKDLRQVLLINQQVAACFNVFIRTVGDHESMAEGASSELRNNTRIEDLTPGGIHYLAQDEEVDVGTPNPTGMDVIGQLDEQLHGVAAAANLPYAVVARNWSKFTYSGGRLELIEGRNVYRSRQQLWRELFLYHFWQQFVFEAVLIGEVSIELTVFAAYEWLFCQAAWIMSGFEWIDPVKDVMAVLLKIEGNLTSRTQALAELNVDAEEIFDELEWEKDELEARGLPVHMPKMNRDAEVNSQFEADSDDAERKEAAAAA